MIITGLLLGLGVPPMTPWTWVFVALFILALLLVGLGGLLLAAWGNPVPVGESPRPVSSSPPLVDRGGQPIAGAPGARAMAFWGRDGALHSQRTQTLTTWPVTVSRPHGRGAETRYRLHCVTDGVGQYHEEGES